MVGWRVGARAGSAREGTGFALVGASRLDVMMMNQQPAAGVHARGARLGAVLNRIGVLFAYGGGLVVAGVGVMSAISIIGRSALRRPITGDFELVEIGIAVAGSLFLPYCQATGGHIVVDFFTLRAGERTRGWLDRFGALLMAVMFLVIAWRAGVGALDLYRNGESSMLMRFPIWLGYALTLPGLLMAGLTALAQSLGVKVAEHVEIER
jgi:TRAP-type C4-dicarboxylate transport system permease small subunit